MYNRKNFFLIFYILFLSLFLSIIVSCNRSSFINESYENLTKNYISKSIINCKYDLFDVALDKNNNIYVIDKDQILILNNELKYSKTIKGNMTSCSLICIEDDRIFVFDTKESKIKEFNKDGILKNSYNVDGTKKVSKMEYMDNKLIIQASDQNSDILIMLDITTGESEKINIPGMKQFSVYPNNKILVYVNKPSVCICVYDLERKEIESKYAISNNIQCFAYDGKSGDVYYSNSGNVYSFNLKDNILKIIFLSSKKSIKKVLTSDDCCYIFDAKEASVYKVSKSVISHEIPISNFSEKVYSKSSKLKILSFFNTGYMEYETLSSVRDFVSKHLSCSISFHSISNVDEYRNAIYAQLNSGDDNFDIYLLYTNLLNIKILKNENWLNLNNYPAITFHIDKFYDGVINLCKNENILIGVPFRFYSEVWTVNDTLLEKLGVQPPKYRWNWQEFCDFSKIVCRDVNGDGMKDIYVLPENVNPMLQYNALYFNNRITSFNTQEYCDLIKISKVIKDEGYCVPPEKKNDVDPENIIFTPKILTNMDEKTNYVLPPTLKSAETYLVSDFVLYAVNKNSRNKDAAVEFLTSYLITGNASKQTYYYMYKDTSLYGNTANANNINASTRQKYEMIKELADNSILYSYDNVNFNKNFTNIMRLVYNNEITPEEAARLMDEILQ